MSEQLSAYRELKNFNFSGRNFSKEYLDFKAIHDSLSEYAENDVHFTNHIFGPPASQSFDPDAMEIDALSASGIVSNEMFDIIDQYQDAMSDPDQAEAITVALDTIRIGRAYQNARVSASACFYCQRPGHFIRDCAASSFITSDLADTLHSPTHTADIPIKVKGAFSTNTNTASSIAEMNFTIRGCTKEFTISLYVVNSIGSHKLIIGNPILQQFPELLTPVCLIDTIDCDSYFDDVESSYVIDTYLCDHCISPDAILIAAMSSEVNPHQLAIDTILKEYPLAIADKLPQPTSTSAYRHSIELLPDAPLPKSNPFTLSLTEEEEVTSQIDKLLELGHINGY
ncbi:hypothetical protein FOG48_03699 [Hanseniaspora uvarum]|nr:hypothetical protein FOG48_03699 [Hanseniaspora uvarum]